MTPSPEKSKVEATEPRVKNAENTWRSSIVGSPQWIRDGCDYANLMSKEARYEDANEALTTILAAHPKSRKAISSHLWNLYRWHIKGVTTVITENRDKPDTAKKAISNALETAAFIISSVKRMEKYTPYVQTIFEIVDMFTVSNDLDSAVLWFAKIDKRYLENKTLLFSKKEFRGCYNNAFGWSQLRRYYELEAGLQHALGHKEDAIWACICMLKDCDNLPKQKDEIHDLIGDISGDSNQIICQRLLIRRGFEERCLRDKYYESLFLRGGGGRKFEYDGKYVTLSDSEYKEECCNNTATNRALSVLWEELLIPSHMPVQKVQQQDACISASDLASFAFCPASYSLQKTYKYGYNPAAKMGTLMHEKQLLISKHKSNTRKALTLCPSGQLTALEKVVDSESLERLHPLIRDLTTATPIVSGHGDARPPLFFDDNRVIVGSPDYVFEKPNGDRFVIEEKFSASRPGQQVQTSAYINHMVQIGTYMLKLTDLRVSYGYLLYWNYEDAPRYGEDGSEMSERATLINTATAFRVEKDTKLHSIVNKSVSNLMRFKEKKYMPFVTSYLNPRKCVNCSVTSFCMHKTGSCNSLSFPYKEFEPQCVANEGSAETVFASFEDAAEVARSHGGTIVRSANGGFEVRQPGHK